MKTSPLTAISSFRAIVDRVDLAFLTRLGVAGCGCHNWHRIAPREAPAHRGDVRYSPRASGTVRFSTPESGRAPSLSRPFAARVFPITVAVHALCTTCLGGGDGVDRTRAYEGPTRARIDEQDAAHRPLVALPADHVRRVHVVHRLRDGPGLPGLALLRRAVPLAVLLAVPRRLRRGLLRLRPAVRLVPAVGGADHPDLPARLPADLLLLPQGLLPVVLAEPAGLRGRRAARDLQRRDPAAADPEQHPPLLLVRRGGGRADPELRHRARPSATRTASGATWASARWSSSPTSC